MRKLSYAIAGAAVLALCSAPVWAQNTGSNASAKTAVMLGNLHIIESSSAGSGQSSSNTDNMSVILETNLKTGNQKHILVGVSLECGNFTDTLVRSKGGKKESSTAIASVRVSVWVDGVAAIPSISSFASPTLSDGTSIGPAGNDGIVFCRRSQTLEATFQGILEIPEGGTLDGCIIFTQIEGLDRDAWIAADPLDLRTDPGLGDADIGLVFDAIQNNDFDTYLALVHATTDSHDEATHQVDFDAQRALRDGTQVISDNCLLPEEVRLILDTMQANHFNFVAPVGSGLHNIKVKAYLDTGAESTSGSAEAMALIGWGVVVAEEVRLVGGSGAEIVLDNDGDGVNDQDDLCPLDDGGGTVDADGCPI